MLTVVAEPRDIWHTYVLFTVLNVISLSHSSKMRTRCSTRHLTYKSCGNNCRGVVFAARVKAGDAHFEENFWLRRYVISKFCYCCRLFKQLRANRTIFFVIFVHLLWLSNDTQTVLFYKVEWQQYLGEVDCQCTSSCTLFFQSCLPKITIIRLNLLKLLYRTLLTQSENGIVDDVTITSALSSDMLIYGESFLIL